MVSGTISLPSRATFHHSLTVLSAIGHKVVFRLTTWSPQIHTRFLEPRATWDPTQEIMTFRLRGYHPLRRPFPRASPTPRFSDSLIDRQIYPYGPTTPITQPLPGITRNRFGLIRFLSPILTEYLFLSVLRCFTSRRSPHTPYIFK